MNAASRHNGRRGGFPWGLLLLGAAGYFLYQYSKTSSAQAPATIAPGEPSPLPPTATATATTTPAQLQAPVQDPRSIVLQAAQQINTPAWLSFARTGADADIAAMASIIQGEWAQYGRCNSDQCTATWSAIANKYNLY